MYKVSDKSEMVGETIRWFDMELPVVIAIYNFRTNKSYYFAFEVNLYYKHSIVVC